MKIENEKKKGVPGKFQKKKNSTDLATTGGGNGIMREAGKEKI